ncbi:Chitinase-like protein 4 [Bulinus truncatus]|nr:Chitinase-like protein 4 [Bulinus truncatus]
MIVKCVTVLSFLSAFVCYSNGHGFKNEKLFICYYSSTSYFPAAQVPSDICSHIIYSYANVTPSGIKPKSSADVENYKILVKLKQKSENLKVLLSLQWGFESVVRADTDVMINFSKSAMAFLQTYGFDGVDLDWEFPNIDDKENFKLFIKILKSEAVKVNKLMSLALPNSPSKFKGYDSDTLTSSLDFMTAMTYDFHLFRKHGDITTGYNSPLFTPKGESKFSSVSAMMNFYISQNITTSKLLMGIPTYGRSWTLSNPSHHDLHAPAVDKGPPGPYRHFQGVYLYPDVCVAQAQGATTIPDDVNGATYLYFNTTWVAFENEITIKKKLTWVNSQNLGGVGVWAMHLDDNSEVCKKGFLPLLTTIKENM